MIRRGRCSMKVKNKRVIALAFLALVLAGFSLFVYIAQGRVRFLFSAILALVWFLTLLFYNMEIKLCEIVFY